MVLSSLLQDATTIYEWQISPSVSGLKEKKNRLTIKANMLKAKQEYRLHVKGEALPQSEVYVI